MNIRKKRERNSSYHDIRMDKINIVTVHRSAIRKTALRAYCGCRHCFTHEKALPTSAIRPPAPYASIKQPALSIRVNCNLILSNEAYRTEGILIFPLPYIIIRFAKRIDKERDQYDRV